MILTALLLGSVVGLVLALTGAGGGILAVPALTLGLGWTMTQASPVALLTVASAAGIGMIGGVLKGHVRIRAAILISTVGLISAPFGQRLAHVLPERWLIGLFGCVMLIVATRIFLKSLNRPAPRTISQTKSCVINTKTGRIDWNLTSFLKLSVIGLISGTATGLLGVGGGFIVVPALLRCSNISMNGIIATSLMVITLISSGAVIAAFSSGHLIVSQVSMLFIAGAVVAMLLGRQFAQRLPAQHMQRGFALLVAAVSLTLLYKLIA
ncbi:MAG: sulfite exporter TauE/SafE family protein [Gallionella sp.]|nr:sulfite exporter TauE/SafE family protein [Gallionella sp.]MDD4947355.1 sulfite exporter TauE/SafE family protein [Gallionella sp.]MDD5612826.1 sulfite exporter TauE/SafE family protein [Gallionella sp.]